MAKKAAKKPAAKKSAAKKAAAKKAAAKRPAAKKAAAKKAAAKKPATKKAAAKKPAAKKPVSKKAAPAKPAAKNSSGKTKLAPKRKASKSSINSEEGLPPLPVRPKTNGKPHTLTPFEKKQQKKLLDLRDSMVDAMNGVAKDSLRGAGDSGDSSAFGMHQADAGSDAYDRDFALSLLSQEQDALYEIEEALKRLNCGAYGTCEMSGKKINHARLEAIPFTRYTVECQAQIERENGGRAGRRPPARSVFGLMEEGSGVETADDSD